jgi:hypothetical protein
VEMQERRQTRSSKEALRSYFVLCIIINHPKEVVADQTNGDKG